MWRHLAPLKAVLISTLFHFAPNTYIYGRADVIKVEHPVRGDDTRAWGPPYAKYEDESREGPGETAYFLAVGIPGILYTGFIKDTNSTTGQPQQKVPWTILPTQVRRRNSSQTRKGM